MISAPTAIYSIRFKKSPESRLPAAARSAAGRVPRVARLLAFAHNIDGMIRSGAIRDWADAARLVGVTRARMTQIANLVLLAPSIQQDILDLPFVLSGCDLITEHDMRVVTAQVHWRMQDVAWILFESHERHFGGLAEPPNSPRTILRSNRRAPRPTAPIRRTRCPA